MLTLWDASVLVRFSGYISEIAGHTDATGDWNHHAGGARLVQLPCTRSCQITGALTQLEQVILGEGNRRRSTCQMLGRGAVAGVGLSQQVPSLGNAMEDNSSSFPKSPSGLVSVHLKRLLLPGVYAKL